MASDIKTVYSLLCYIPKDHAIGLLTTNAFLLLISLPLNLFLCYAILKLRLLNRTSFRFILVLTISDLCTILIVEPLHFVQYTFAFIGNVSSHNWQLVTQFCGFTFGQFSGVMILIIALDRYLHMKYLNNYSSVMTEKRSTILILINAATSLICAILFTISSIYGFFFYINIVYLFVDLAVFLICCLVYLQALIKIRTHVADSNIRNDTSRNHIRRADVQFAKGVLFIMLAISICYMPYFITGIIAALEKRNQNNGVNQSLAASIYWSMELVLTVPIINTFLLVSFNKKLKNFMLTIMNRNVEDEKSQRIEMGHH